MRRALCIFAAFLTACTYTRYSRTDGRSFVRFSLLNKLSISNLTVTPNADGSETITLGGYANDQASAAADIAAAAARGAAMSVANSHDQKTLPR